MKKIMNKWIAVIKKPWFSLRKGTRKEKQEALLSIFLWSFFAIVLLSTTIFTLVTYRHYFHSDAATAAMIAPFQKQNGLFVPGWNYSQDFWPFFVFNPVIVLEPILHSEYLATQLSVVLQSIIIMFLMMKLLNKVFKSKLNILIVCFAFTCSAFDWFDALFGQGQYGNVLMWLLLCMWLTLECLQQETRWKRCCLEGGLWLAICYSNSTSVRYLPFFVLPMIAALLVRFWLGNEKSGRRRTLVLVGNISTAAFAGIMLLGYLSEHLLFQAGNAGRTILSYQEIVGKNVDKLFLFLFQLAAPEAAGIQLASLDGVKFFYLLLGFLAFSLLPIWLYIRFFRCKQWDKRPDALIVVVYAVMVTAISILCIMFSNLAYHARYLMIAVYCGLLVLPLFLELFENRIGCKVFICILTIPMMVLGMCNLNKKIAEQPQADRVIEFLLKNNCTEGYAEYWEADKFTVLSDHKVEINHILIDTMQPRMFMSCAEQYQSMTNGRYFLLLKEEDVAKAESSPLKEYMGEPIELLEIENYQIWIYDKPFYGNIPGWGIE